MSTKMKKEHGGSLKRTNYESGIKRRMNEKYKIICVLSHQKLRAEKSTQAAVPSVDLFLS